ncbi:MAG: 5'-nucleotidase C-terminal domain-containing protein [Actinomycetaceae bacterium]|nr:5'-nucleotidase C-terminal domain-containing protein [Actinomycetaceae bacterium]
MKGSILRPVALLAGASIVGAGLALPAAAENTVPNTDDSSTTGNSSQEAENQKSDLKESKSEKDANESKSEENMSEESKSDKDTNESKSEEGGAKESASEGDKTGTRTLQEENAPKGDDSSTDASSTISILAISDFHGYLNRIPNMMCQINDIKSKNENVIFVSNGDNVGGSAYISAVNDDLPTLEMLNAMKLDVTSVGNHEFDRGQTDLEGRLQEKSAFPYTVANVEGLDQDLIPPYVVIPKGNIDVAFVGAVTDDLPSLVSADGIKNLKITDPVATIDRVAAQLKDGDDTNGEADLVVALFHEGYSVAQNIGADVDLVIAGHSHATHIGETLSGAPLVQPGSFGKILSKIEFEIDADSNITVKEDGVKNLDVKVSTDDEPVCEDKTFKDMYDAYKADADEKGNVPLGTIDGKARRGTNYGFDPALTDNENRGTESTAGNLIAQGFYEYSKMNGLGADFGLINSGGIRADLDENGDGVITKGESQSTQPFDGDMGTVDLTAQQVFALLEQQWQPEGKDRPVLQLGLSDTISYTYDPSAPRGSKIKTVKIHDQFLDREDTKTTYRVIAGTFMLGGGDNFTVLTEGTNFKNYGQKDLAVFNEFLVANPGWKVNESQRAVGVTAPETVVAGSKVSVKLSSLSMTADEAKPDNVTISLGEKVLGSAPVDNAVTPLMPETGQATVEFTVPADLKAGEHMFTIRAGDTMSYMFLNVTAPVKPSGDDAKSDAQDTTGDKATGTLANTGVEIWGLASVGLLLLITGAGAVALKRRELV